MKKLLSLTMAYRHFRFSFRSMALSVVAITLGVALVVGNRLTNAAVTRSFAEAIDAAIGSTTYSVVAGEGLTFSEDVVNPLRAIRGVDLAVPLVRATAFPDDHSGEILVVHGLDLTDETAVAVYHRIKNKDRFRMDLNNPNSVLLGREFAERRGLKEHDKINLVTPNGIIAFTIQGLLEPQGLARTLGGRIVVMDLPAAEMAFTAEGQINQVDIVVKQPDPDVRTAIKAAAASVLPQGLRLEEPAIRRDVVQRAVNGFQTMLTGFSLLAIFAGFVICYARLTAILEARTWEVGLFRAVGLRRSVVFWEMLKESLIIGVLGCALGMPLGILISRLALSWQVRFTALNFRLPVPLAQSALHVGPFLLGSGVGLLAAVSAAVLPAVRLASRSPVATLTMRGREVPGQAPPTRWAVRLLLLLLIVGSVVLQRTSHLVVLGHATTALIALATCLFAGPLVVFWGRVLKSLWQGVFGPMGQFAASHLTRQPRRTGLTVATLGVGLGAVLLFGTLVGSFERTLVSRLTASIRSDLIVSSAFLGHGYRPAPISENILDDLRAIPGVALVAGEQSTDIEYAGGTTVLKSYDPACFRDERLYRWPLDRGSSPDALDLVSRGNAVLVSSAFAHQHRVQPGTQIELMSPHGALFTVVVGVTSGQPENAVIMSRDVYRNFWNDGMIYLAYLALDRSATPDHVQAMIARQLGERYRLQIRSAHDLIDYFASQVRDAFQLQYVAEAVTLFLVLIGIADALTAGVAERTREFGMMRAVGLRRMQLSGVVLLEGAAIGFLGLLLAAATGISLGIFWAEVQIPAIVGWTLDLSFPTRFALGAAVLTMLLCVAGSLLPSARAARVSVAEALRAE